MRAGLLLLATLVAAACGPGPIVRHGVVNDDLLGTLERRVAATRGLPFRARIPARVLTDADVAHVLDAELDRNVPPGDLERLERAYVRLGLLPGDRSFREVLQELYGGQLAALYDPREKYLALTTRGVSQGGATLGAIRLLTGRDLLGEMLVAHELTHGLQDQHYGLPTAPQPMADAHGDRAIARRALLEGDATLTSIAVLRGGDTDAATLAGAAEGLTGIAADLAAKYPRVPAILRDGLAFQYADGSRLVAALYARGGWPAVDRAHRDPPVSSEQVLHLEKYLDVREDPDRVSFGTAGVLERAGWTRTLEDTVGEHGIRVLARATVEPARADAIAQGWGGDRLRAYERGDTVRIVWLTSWDTSGDATEFAQAVPTLLPEATVDRRGNAVLVLLGVPPGEARRLWDGARIVHGGQREGAPASGSTA